MHFRLRHALVALFITTFAAPGCDNDAIELPTFEYSVGFHVAPTAGPIGALQIEVEFVGSDGFWFGANAGVACTWSVDATLRACNDKGDGRLACAVVDSTGFVGPTALMECAFGSRDAEVVADDFIVEVVDASGPDLAPIEVEVTPSVERIGNVTTTTFDPDDEPEAYDVEFELVEASDAVGALQIDVTHPGVPGTWIDVGGRVDCRWLVESDLRACNERDDGRLACAVVDPEGLEAPVPIFTCGFVSVGEVTPDAFMVRVVDSSAPDLSPIDATVVVSRVTARLDD